MLEELLDNFERHLPYRTDERCKSALSPDEAQLLQNQIHRMLAASGPKTLREMEVAVREECHEIEAALAALETKKMVQYQSTSNLYFANRG